MARPLKWPRRLRIAVAAGTFTIHLVAFGFVSALSVRILNWDWHFGTDFLAYLGTSSLNTAITHSCGWNVGPELLAARAGVISAAVLAPLALWILLALLAGRFYCAAFCPFGILQDLLGVLIPRRSLKKSSVPRPLPSVPLCSPLGAIRYIIFFVSILFLAAGYATGFQLLDPYTNFGAVAAATASPALFHLQNWVLPNDTLTAPPYTLAVALTGFIPLVLLAALVAWRRRAFCAVLCPVGTFLGFLSKRPLFRLAIDAPSCVGCGSCARRCPVGAIDPVTHTVDNALCVRCMNCLAACPARAIRWEAPNGEHGGTKGNSRGAEKNHLCASVSPCASVLRENAGVREPSVSRRAFVAGGGFAAAAAVGGVFAAVKTKKDAVICPPGAGSMAEFARRCTGCQACVVNCPGTVLRPAGWSHPTVRMVYDTGLCEFNCKRCTEVCPTGALKRMTLVEKQHTRIGRAHFHPELCVAVQEHHDCGACAEHCPTGALQMVPDEHGVPVPHFTEELCIGCGNCEHPCPVRPGKAIVVEPIAVQERATDPQEYFKAHPPKANAPMSEGGDWLI